MKIHVVRSAVVLITILSAAFLFAESSTKSLPPGTSPDWLNRVQQNLRNEEYFIRTTDSASSQPEVVRYRASNTSQNLQADFAESRISLAPRSTQSDRKWKWSLRMDYTVSGFAGDKTPLLNVDRNRIEYHRKGIVEWYVNSPDGIEQGFTIYAPSRAAEKELALDMQISTDLHPRLAEDGQSVDFFADGNFSVLRCSQLKVTDAGGRVLPSHMAAIDGGLRLVVDQTSAIYPITIDPVYTTAAWTGSGEQDGAYFGYSVATAGDVNGDGYADIIVGAPLHDYGTGRAYVFLGSASRVSTIPAWIATGDVTLDRFGISVATAGDVNGDGYSDVIVGAEHDAQYPTIYPGRAYVYLGSATGLSSTAVWIRSEGAGRSQFGHSVATAGDVNGDGYSDIIVGTGDDDHAYVYLGSPSGPATNAVWVGSGILASDYGHSVATAGDVNADGFSDIIVAERYNSVYVYHGSAAGPAPSASWIAGVSYAQSVATAGDVNADGYADVIVGAPAAGGGSAGQAYVYLGSAFGLSSTPAWTVTGDVASAQFGVSVSTAGDVNGDGYADIIVGANGHSGFAGVARGRAYVYLGSASGPALSEVWLADGAEDNGLYGVSVGTAGDVNGDGISDIIVGALGQDAGGTDRGRAYVYSGYTTPLPSWTGWTGSGDELSGNYGCAVSSAGDVNGDGYSDAIVGACNHSAGGANRGRAYVYLGSANGTGTTPAWTASGDEDDAYFGYSVSTAGDVNGDGYSDIMVGAHQHDAGGGTDTNRGRVYLYLGSPSGLSATPPWTASGDEDDALFGSSVSTVGDVNGDGYSDVVIGARGHSGGLGGNTGRAYVYLGSNSGLSLGPIWTGTGDEIGALYGDSVASAGDVNRDGYSDVMVSASLHNAGGTGRGRAYVYFGSASGPSTNASWTASGDEDLAYFGHSAASAGDVNGDGYSDLIIGAYGHDSGAGANANRGRAYIYYGTNAGPWPSPNWVGFVSVSDNGIAFGQTVSSAGDVNGDGYSDVIVGAYLWGTNDPGRAYVMLGSAFGVGATGQSQIGSGNEDNAWLGYAVAGIGDTNGDGYSDVIVGAVNHTGGLGQGTGQAYIYEGNSDSVPLTLRQMRSDSSAPIAPLGLAHNLSFQIGMLLRTPYGRGSVRMQWQVAPLSSAFNLVDHPIQSSSWMNSDVSGLTWYQQSAPSFPAGPWKWRARVAYRATTSPFQKNSRWFSIPGNSTTETDLRSTTATPPPPCYPPDEPIWIYAVTQSVPDAFLILHFQDPNQPSQRTGYHVRRNIDPGAPENTWPLVATNIVDMDQATPNNQWTDTSGDDPGPGNVWYYQVTAYNGNCSAEGPF